MAPDGDKDQPFQSPYGAYHPYDTPNPRVIGWDCFRVDNSINKPTNFFLGQWEQGIFSVTIHQEPPNFVKVFRTGDPDH